MSDKRPVNRIPFESIESAQSWALPSLDDSQKIVPSVKKGSEEDAAGDSTTRIEEVEPEEVEPLTVDQLQEMAREAEAEAKERGYQEGLKKGFEEGHAQGLKQGKNQAYNECKTELEEKIGAFNQLINALMDPVDMQDNALENWIIDSAVKLAKHLINRELIEDPSAVFHIVEKAVACMPAGANHICVYLHADDVELAHEAFAQNGRSWRILTDPSLSRGGCRIESDQSAVDYSLENRLQAMLDEVTFQGEVEEPDEDSGLTAEFEDIQNYQPAAKTHAVVETEKEPVGEPIKTTDEVESDGIETESDINPNVTPPEVDSELDEEVTPTPSQDPDSPDRITDTPDDMSDPGAIDGTENNENPVNNIPAASTDE